MSRVRYERGGDGAQVDGEQAEGAQQPPDVEPLLHGTEGKQFRGANIALENHFADRQCPSS